MWTFCENYKMHISGIDYYVIGYWKTDETRMKNRKMWTFEQLNNRSNVGKSRFKIRIILIFRKILFPGFVRKCHFFTSWFLRFSEKTFQRSNVRKCILSYIETTPMFTKWKRLHFNHQGRGWFSHNFSHDFPVIPLFWYPYIIHINRIFMLKNQ